MNDAHMEAGANAERNAFGDTFDRLGPVNNSLVLVMQILDFHYCYLTMFVI